MHGARSRAHSFSLYFFLCICACIYRSCTGELRCTMKCHSRNIHSFLPRLFFCSCCFLFIIFSSISYKYSCIYTILYYTKYSSLLLFFSSPIYSYISTIIIQVLCSSCTYRYLDIFEFSFFVANVECHQSDDLHVAIYTHNKCTIYMYIYNCCIYVRVIHDVCISTKKKKESDLIDLMPKYS